MARVSATTYNEKAGYSFQAFYGADAQLWLMDRLFLGAGAGVATHSRAGLSDDTSTGFVGDIRAGFVVAPMPRLDFAVVIEALPAVYGDRFVLGASLGIGFQHI